MLRLSNVTRYFQDKAQQVTKKIALKGYLNNHAVFSTSAKGPNNEEELLNRNYFVQQSNITTKRFHRKVHDIPLRIPIEELTSSYNKAYAKVSDSDSKTLANQAAKNESNENTNENTSDKVEQNDKTNLSTNTPTVQSPPTFMSKLKFDKTFQEEYNKMVNTENKKKGQSLSSTHNINNTTSSKYKNITSDTSVTHTDDITIAHMTEQEKVVYRIEQIIDSAYKREHHPSMLWHFKKIKLENIQVSYKCYMQLLWACTRMNNKKAEEAFWIYRKLIESNSPITIDVFVDMLQICVNINDYKSALDIYQTMKNMCATGSIKCIRILLPYLMHILIHDLSATSSHQILYEDCTLLFQEFVECIQRNTAMVSYMNEVYDSDPHIWMKEIYQNYVILQLVMKEEMKAFDALRQLTEAGYEPTMDMCRIFIEYSLVNDLHNFTRLMSKWFLESFEMISTDHKHRLSYKEIFDLLHYSLLKTDEDLALCAFKLFIKYQHTIHPTEYVTTARIFWAKDDFISGLDYIFAAETSNINFYDHSYLFNNKDFEMDIIDDSNYTSTRTTDSRTINDEHTTSESSSTTTTTTLVSTSIYEDRFISRDFVSNLGVRLQYHVMMYFVNSTSSNVDKLDECYYILLDLVQKGLKIPLVLLNAFIMSYGRLSQLNRAFSIFEEIESTFKQSSDIYTYNALLYGTSYLPLPKVSSALSLFQLMEKQNIEPDQTSFSYLFTIMSESGDFKMFDLIWEHVSINEDILPPLHTLRLLAVSLARYNQFDKVELVMKIITEKYNILNMSVPVYLLRRLQSYRVKHNLELIEGYPQPLIPLVSSSYSNYNKKLNTARSWSPYSKKSLTQEVGIEHTESNRQKFRIESAEQIESSRKNDSEHVESPVKNDRIKNTHSNTNATNASTISNIQ